MQELFQRPVNNTPKTNKQQQTMAKDKMQAQRPKTTVSSPSQVFFIPPARKKQSCSLRGRHGWQAGLFR